MLRIRLSEDVSADAGLLFFLSEDYEARKHWDPFMRSQEFLEGAKRVARGVKTRTIACNDMSMDTEFIAFDRPNVIAMKMLSGPWMFQSMAGTWRFRKLDDARTRVEFIYSFAVKPAVARRLIEPVVGWKLSRDMRH